MAAGEFTVTKIPMVITLADLASDIYTKRIAEMTRPGSAFASNTSLEIEAKEAIRAAKVFISTFNEEVK